MSTEAQSHRDAWSLNSAQALQAVQLWCKAKDIPPEERADRVAAFVAKVQAVVRDMEW